MDTSLQSSTAPEGAFSLTLLSQTVTKARVLESGDGERIITVPSRVLKQNAMAHLGEQITQIVSVATQTDIDQFEIESGFHLDKNSMCRALVTTNCHKTIDVKTAQSATRRYFQKIKGVDGESSDLLCGDLVFLNTDVVEFIDNLAADVLHRVGGSAISYPLNMFVNGLHFAEFSGSFGPRPDVSNNVRSMQVDAQFQGFWRKRRTVFLEFPDGSSIRANWTEQSDFPKILALANSAEATLRMTLSVSQDQVGKPVYTIVL